MMTEELKARRIQIAKNTLELLPKITATMNRYLGGIDVDKLEDTTECVACQIGAMYLSLVIENPRKYRVDFRYVPTKVFPYSPASIVMRDRLEKVFSGEELLLMECAYSGLFHRTNKGDITFREFLNKVPLHKDRIRIICQNIINNEGMFVYSQLPGFLECGVVSDAPS